MRHFAGVPAVQWHGDTFDLPEGVERLAGSAQYENQAFAKGDWLLAVQFHPEVDDAIHEDWLDAWGDELPEYGLDREQLRAQRDRVRAAMQAASARLLGDTSMASAVGRRRRVGAIARSSSDEGGSWRHRRDAVARSSRVLTPDPALTRLLARRATTAGAAGRRRSRAAGERMPRPRAPGDDLDPVVQPAVAQHVVDRAGGARLLVPRAEHESRHARREDRARAHHARLERDDERALVEVPVAEAAAARAQRDDLGVRGGVAASARARCVARRSPRPRHPTTTAPTGTSRVAGACSASASARRIHSTVHRKLHAPTPSATTPAN